MSAESLSTMDGAEFRARPVQTTERGTEVSPSRTGNRIIDAANRVANFLDRFKVGRQEARENTLDAVEQGRLFLRTTGEKAAKAAIAGGEIVLGATVLGAEAAGRGILKGSQAAVEGTRKAGAWLEEKNDALQTRIDTRVDQAIDWTTDKVDTVKKTAVETVGYVEEGLRGGVEYAKQKGADAKEAALDRIEATKSFFKEKAEAAKTRREARRERWNARVAAGKEAVSAKLERGKEKGAEFRAKAQKRGHAAVMAARAARIVYTANVRS